MGVLNRIGRGRFILGEGKFFIPEISFKMISLYKKLVKEFPYLKICIWNTSDFNEFMLHQPEQFFILIEVEKDATEAVFYFLKELKYSVFIEPNSELLEKYLPNERDILIVKSMVSEAPIQKVKGIITTSLEKMLVDIFCDNVLFGAQQGGEMRTIFNEAFAKYLINQNRILRYADRRGKKHSFKKYLTSTTNLRQ